MMIRSDVEMSPSPFRSYMALALVTGCMKNDSKFNKSLSVIIDVFGPLTGEVRREQGHPYSRQNTRQKE